MAEGCSPGTEDRFLEWAAKYLPPLARRPRRVVVVEESYLVRRVTATVLGRLSGIYGTPRHLHNHSPLGRDSALGHRLGWGESRWLSSLPPYIPTATVPPDVRIEASVPFGRSWCRCVSRAQRFRRSSLVRLSGGRNEAI